MDWTLRGPWTANDVTAFLRRSVIPLRLACPGPDGHPVIATQWFMLENNSLLCATQRDSYIASMIRRDSRCGIEVSSENLPYQGLRGQAMASLDDERGRDVLDRLIHRYLDDTRTELAHWLRSRSGNETAIVLEPIRVSCWDYGNRMAPSD